MMRPLRQQALGYLVGALLVWGLIPGVIYGAARLIDPLFGIGLFPDGPLRIVLVLALLPCGLVFGIWAIICQNTVGKGGPVQLGQLDISPRTQVLVTTGPYRFSRNPMLFGACLVYLAFALFLDSIVAVAMVGIFTAAMLVLVKLSEEKRLLQDFGDQYREYRRRVPFFIPWFH